MSSHQPSARLSTIVATFLLAMTALTAVPIEATAELGSEQLLAPIVQAEELVEEGPMGMDTPDPGFGGTGLMTLDWGAIDQAYAVAQQSDGKILVAGWVRPDDLPSYEPAEAVVVRLTEDGSLDPTFDGDGVATVTGGDYYFYDLAIQADGKIIAVGKSTINLISGNMLIARFNGNGTLDTTFDSDGILDLNLGDNEWAEGVALQSDGKIVLAGGTDDRFAAVRLLTTGALDTTFDTDGIATILLGAGNDLAFDVMVQPDGGIVLAGTADVTNAWGQKDVGLVRLLTDGSLDPTFDGDGKARIDLGAQDAGFGAALQADGKIVVVGEMFAPGDRNAIVARVTTAGGLDTTFSGDGVVDVPFGASFEQFDDVAIQPDGKLVVAGHSGTVGTYDFAIGRVLPDGSLDTSFGGGGHVLVDFGGDDHAWATAIQADGKILAVGDSDDNWAIVRLADAPVSTATFRITPHTDSVHGSGWEPDPATISITINPGPSQIVVPAFPPGPSGDWGIGVDGYDIVAGDIIEVTDGTNTKTLEVAALTVDVIDQGNDTLTGNAPADALVSVLAWDPSSGVCTLDVIAAPDGSWLADFGGPPCNSDITADAEGQAEAFDDDGDSTHLYWEAVYSTLLVNLSTDDVYGSGWAPDPATVTITFNPGPAEVSIPGVPVGPGGEFGTHVGDVHDVVGGDILEVTDGFNVEYLEVATLTIDIIDVLNDFLAGTAPPDTPLSVLAFDPSSGACTLDITAAPDGTWLADFGAPPCEIDITANAEGQIGTTDPNGHTTELNWDAPNPRFAVNADNYQEVIDGTGWDPDASTVTITINPGPGEVLIPDVPLSSGYFYTFTTGIHDMVDGDIIEVTDGISTKVHQVAGMTVDDIDVLNDTVAGTAPPDAPLRVDTQGPTGGCNLDITAEPDGSWLADLGAAPCNLDLGPDFDGQVTTEDDDGDSTYTTWRTFDPQFTVYLGEGISISGNDWDPDALATVIVNPGPAEVVLGDIPIYPWGGFGLGVFDLFDIVGGDLIEVTDGTTTKTHEVAGLTVDVIDPDTDTIGGTAPSSTALDLNANTPTGGCNTVVTSESDGSWLVDLSADPCYLDLVPGSGGSVQVTDLDGDETYLHWRVPEPQFTVNPADDVVEGYDWEPEPATATVTINPEAGEVVFPDVPIYEHGSFYLDLAAEYDFVGGEIVEVTDGTSVKTLAVMALTVDLVDPDTETVAGTAPPGTSVSVDGGGRDEGCGLEAIAEPDGSWVANLGAAPCNLDLRPGYSGAATIQEPDRDSTRVYWRIPEPQFTVRPHTNEIWGYDWEPEPATVTITINPGPSEVVLPVSPSPYGDFGTDTNGVHDIVAGDIIEVTDGTTTKTHEVAVLTVDLIDVDNDAVSGTAPPDALLDVGAYDGLRGCGAEITAQPDGSWTANLGSYPCYLDVGPTTDGSVVAPDADGDRTDIDWTATPPDVEAPTVSVTEPVALSTVSLPTTAFGTATDNVGVAEVRVEIYNRDTGQWWNGADWQPARTHNTATLDTPGGVTTGWDYPFDPATAAVLPYWMTVRSVDTSNNTSDYTYINFTGT